MSELPLLNYNQQTKEEVLRPFAEIAVRQDLVYHGIGADLIALQGIVNYGIIPVDTQLKMNGRVNSNSTRALAKNGNNLVSVVHAPELGKPNAAFFSYIDRSPISIVISAGNKATQPSDRGYFDESFITSAGTEEIAGIVLDADTMNRPLVDMPIVSGNVTVDVVADKARNYLEFIVSNLGADADNDRLEIKTLINDIKHLTTDHQQAVMGFVHEDDIAKIDRLDEKLRFLLTKGLVKTFGNADMTVLDAVRLNLPTKPIYVNSHEAVNPQTNEEAYFDTLNPNEQIGYSRFDGLERVDGSTQPSVYKLRKMLFRLRPDK